MTRKRKLINIKKFMMTHTAPMTPDTVLRYILRKDEWWTARELLEELCQNDPRINKTVTLHGEVVYYYSDGSTI